MHVAVGAIVNARGEVLVARRAAYRHQGGRWEFPGGKVDAGETIRAALARELREELGIEVLAAEPLVAVRHAYAEQTVLLDVWLVTHWQGEAHGREQQPLRWLTADALEPREFPAANAAIIDALRIRLRNGIPTADAAQQGESPT